MRVCFTSDFHGRLAHYDQLTHLLRVEAPDLLILGGDMHREVDPVDPLGSQVAFVEATLPALIETWKRSVPQLTVACIAGNHDLACTCAVLRAQHDAGRLVYLDLQRPWQKDGLSFLGMPATPPTPYWVKDWERLDRPGDPLPPMGGGVWDMAARRVRPVGPAEHFHRLPTLVTELDAAPHLEAPWVFVCHVPPYKSKLDRLPEVDHPIGSRAVREFIEARHPLCALHGHVHESPEVSGDYRDYVGQTMCVNPGQSHDRLHAVLFDTARPAETMRHTVYG